MGFLCFFLWHYKENSMYSFLKITHNDFKKVLGFNIIIKMVEVERFHCQTQLTSFSFGLSKMSTFYEQFKWRI